MSSSENNLDKNIWHLQANHAQLQIPQFAAQVDLAAPALGLQQLSYAGSPVTGYLLGVSTSEATTNGQIQASDVFTRGGDLVATYAETDNQPNSLEIYWQVAAGEKTLVIDLLLSIETLLLESFPAVTTHTQFAAGETWGVPLDGTNATEITDTNSKILNQAPLCVVLRPEGANWSYAEMQHPDDQGKVNVVCHTKEPTHIERDFGEAFLEKGVIRRMRVRGAFVPRESDLQLAGQLFNELATEAPPLTA